jgi:quercetin dioxygenase-like cupin family protein
MTDANACLTFDLAAEVDRLHADAAWSTGRSARTLVKHDDFRVIVLALKAGVSIPEHQTRGRLSVQVLSGHLRMTASGRTFELEPGHLLTLASDEPHAVDALQDSAFLLTTAP